MTNILLITADDMDAQTPGHAGGVVGATPALDRLAREGVSLRRSHVAVAVCQPKPLRDHDRHVASPQRRRGL